MRRCLFNLAAGLSAALCLLAVVGVVRTRWASDAWTSKAAVARPDGRFDFVLRGIASADGSLWFGRHVITVDAAELKEHLQAFAGGWRSGRPRRGRETFPSGDFELRRERLPPNAEGLVRTLDQLAVPWWFIAVTSAVLPLIWIARRRRLVRRRCDGLCPACGYDLRATPQRCPECGAAARTATAAA